MANTNVSSNSITNEVCRGSGECLMHSTSANSYEKNPAIICQHNCQPIPCANFLFCGNLSPQLFLKHGTICVQCDIAFGSWQDGPGRLTFHSNINSCVICMNEGTNAGEGIEGVNLPNCEHSICISCFKRCFKGDQDKENEPSFPYSKELEEQYHENQENPLLANDPLIIEYNRKWNEWDDRNVEKYEQEENLRKCPLCRQ